MTRIEELVQEYGNTPTLGAGRTRDDVMSDIVALACPQGVKHLPVEPTVAALDAIAGEPYRELSPTKQAAQVAAYMRLVGVL